VTRLRLQQLDQRIATIEGAFRRLGHVDVARQDDSLQTFVITVTHPGWGAIGMEGHGEVAGTVVPDRVWQLRVPA
jgi:hypothetical protein